MVTIQSDYALSNGAAIRPSALSQAFEHAKTIKILLFSLVLVVTTQKIALPLGGNERNQVAVALLVEYATLFYLMLKGRAFVHPLRLALFLLVAALLFLFNSIKPLSDYSMPALLLFVVIMAMYVVVIPMDFESYKALMGKLVVFGMIAGGLVWMDWATQIAGLGMPNIEKVLPASLLYHEYNYLKRMWWGMLHLTPNGFFFLEPSHVSQFLAMALIVETALFQRFNRMIYLAVTTMASFGGTGLLLLVLCAPFLIARLKPWMILISVMLLPLALVLALQLGVIDNIQRRTGEFDNRNASATLRFSRPIEAVTDAATGPIDTFLFGKGPGTMPKGLASSGQALPNWSPYAKSIVEQGLIVFLVWMAMFCYCVFRPGIPFVIAFAGFIQFHLLNGSLGVPLHSIYCLFLSASYIIVDRQTAPQRSSPSLASATVL